MAQFLPGENGRAPNLPLVVAPVRRPLTVVRRSRLWLADPGLTEVWIHWCPERRRSFECGYFLADGPCEGCDSRKLARRPVVLVQVHDYAQRYPVSLMYVTPLGVKSCPALTDEPGVLPWSLIETWRFPETPQGRQFIRVVRAEPPARRPATAPTLEVYRGLLAAGPRRIVPTPPRIFRPNPEDEAPSVGPPENDWPQGGPDDGQRG